MIMKKIPALLLASLMAACLLSACGGQSADNSSQQHAQAGNGDVVLINAANEVTNTTAEEMLQTYTDNAVKAADLYDDSYAIVIGNVDSVDTDEYLLVGDLSYTTKATVHLDNGFVISVPSDNEVLLELDKGDTVRILGKIAGIL